MSFIYPVSRIHSFLRLQIFFFLEKFKKKNSAMTVSWVHLCFYLDRTKVNLTNPDQILMRRRWFYILQRRGFEDTWFYRLHTNNFYIEIRQTLLKPHQQIMDRSATVMFARLISKTRLIQKLIIDNDHIYSFFCYVALSEPDLYLLIWYCR